MDSSEAIMPLLASNIFPVVMFGICCISLMCELFMHQHTKHNGDNLILQHPTCWVATTKAVLKYAAAMG